MKSELERFASGIFVRVTLGCSCFQEVHGLHSLCGAGIDNIIGERVTDLQLPLQGSGLVATSG